MGQSWVVSRARRESGVESIERGGDGAMIEGVGLIQDMLYIYNSKTYTHIANPDRPRKTTFARVSTRTV